MEDKEKSIDKNQRNAKNLKKEVHLLFLLLNYNPFLEDYISKLDLPN
jgi:hypothetical protein